MHSSRCYVCAAELDGDIYACGGFDGTNRHSSVERYCPGKNQWQMVADMTSIRSDAGACGVDGTSSLGVSLGGGMEGPVADVADITNIRRGVRGRRYV